MHAGSSGGAGGGGAGGAHDDSFSHAAVVAALARPPDWDSYLRAGRSDGDLFGITRADVDAIREFEGQPADAVEELLGSDAALGGRYVRGLLAALRNITDEGTVTTPLFSFLRPSSYDC